MALETIIIGENMGIFSKIHRHSKGIAAATALAAASVGADANAQNYDNLPVKMSPEIQEQLDNKVIPPFLSRTIFASVPHSEEIIRYVNSKNVRTDRLAYMLNYSDGTVLARDISEDISFFAHNRLEASDYQNPATILLAKIAMKSVGYIERYDYVVDKLRKEQIEKNPGTYHFAKALTTDRKSTEEHLLKALYYAFHGNDNGATPLLNGSFVNMSKVQEKVEEWGKKDYRPLDPYHNSMLAYFSETLLDQKPKNEVLAGLSMMLLFDYYGELNENRATAYHLLYNSFKDMPNFRIDLEKGYKIPFEVFE